MIDGSDLFNLTKKGGEEIECYACGYCIDSTTLNIKRNVEPTKGVLKRNNTHDVTFYPYGKRGQVLKTGISFYGNGYGTELTANVNEDEIYKTWGRLKDQSLNIIARQEQRIQNLRNSVLETFKGV